MNSPTTPTSSARLPAELRLFARIALALTALAWGVAGLAFLLHWNAPYNWPLAPRGNSFFDYKTFFDRFKDLHQPAFFNGGDRQFSYFAAGVPLYEFFYQFRRGPGFVVFTLIVLAGLGWGLLRLRRAMIAADLPPATVTRFLAISLLTSYPLLFSYERGNVETLLAIAITVGLWAFCRGRLTAAALLWGVFGAVKLYPLLLSALFLSRRQYRAFFLTLVTAVATTLLSLWYTGPTFAMARAGIQGGTNSFLQTSTLAVTESLSWDHSFFAAIKLLLTALHAPFAHLLTPFLLTAGSIMLVLYFARIRQLPIANQILILCLCEVLLPPSSYDYTLLQLYGAWGVLVWVAIDASRKRQRVPSLAVTFALLALLLTPSNLVALPGYPFNGLFKCVVLLGLLVLSIAIPLRAVAQPLPEPAGELHHFPAADARRLSPEDGLDTA